MSQSNISIILVDTQLPENVGLSSRAMFNFGIEDLKIVSPKLEWPSEKAHAVAVDSHSIIDYAKVYKDLKMNYGKEKNEVNIIRKFKEVHK